MTARRILCFGDSLTWGWVGVEAGAPTTRYERAERWTGVMQEALGDGFEIVEEGLSARTTSLDDPLDPRLNGSAYLPACIASHLPLDLVVLMLGTNDTKAYFRRSPFEIAAGMAKLVGIVQSSAGGIGTVYPAPGVLVVAPPPIAEMPDPWFAALFEGAREKMGAMATHYEDLAAFHKVAFLDAGQVVETAGVDGIHFSAENNAELGRAIAQKVGSLLG